ncbi:Rpn family recombination-promoting nuclease/putative transposase [Siminovitchia fortis]|nr:Rpn family recombination-promoting nuclease/putative transposase [Siminovitchia fortis]
MNDETLRTAFQSWEELSGTQEEMIAYEARLKRVLDEEAAVREAELRVQEAREKGKEEGKEEITRRLLKMKMDVSTIAEITRLPKERVIEIQEEMNR